MTLGGIPDNQRLTVTLANVNNAGGSVSASVGFLVGDVTNSRSVTASDILRMKGRIGQGANSGNYPYDADLSGPIDTIDLAAVKARAGLSIP